jgi:peptidoglycan-associated lipoprotein
MRIPVRNLTSAAVFLLAVSLIMGCGGSSPAVDTDMTDTEPEPEPAVDEPAVEVEPPERDDTMVYVDPNEEYASVLVPIYFEFNRSRIIESAKPTLEQIADLLDDHPNWRVLIEGHCDERGTSEYNLTLGEARSQATKRYLVSLGIASSRFQTISYGEERPVAFGHDEESWALNRRAEFRVEAPKS